MDNLYAIRKAEFIYKNLKEKQQSIQNQRNKQFQPKKSLLEQSIQAVKLYWTTKKITDISLESILGKDWEQTLTNKESNQYPNEVQRLRDSIDAWIKQNRPESQKPPTLEITEDLINKFSSAPNFETKEKVEELLNPVKDNEEFLQQNPNLTNKSPKEIIIATKRFEYDKATNKESKENEIRQYYNLKEDELLTEEQINEYLYLEAIGQLQEKQAENTLSGQPANEDSALTALIVVIVWVVIVLSMFLMVRVRRKKQLIK